jgi:ribose transport system substrate-binding protein
VRGHASEGALAHNEGGFMTSHRHFRLSAIAALGSLLITVVACGDDDDASSTAPAPADSTGPAGSEPAGTEPAETTAASGGEAAAMMEELLSRPTEITNTAPIDAEIPSDKNIMWIQCSVPACIALGEPLQEASDALGWNLKIVSHDGTPEGVKAAYEQAVREEPDGVVSSGYPRSIFEPELQQLAAKDIPVIQVTVTDPPGDGISAVVNGPPRNAEVGRQLAIYTAADSDGEANALWVTSTFPILVPEFEGVDGTGGFEPTLTELCPDCSIETLEIPVEALATEAPSRIVAHLQANPDINYVVGAFGDIVSGVPGALADAGLADSVNVVTYSQNPTLSAYLAEEEIDALIGFPGPEDMWQVADTFARIFAGAEYEEAFDDLPSWIITSGDVPSTTEHYPLVADYQEQYKALWGLT